MRLHVALIVSMLASPLTGAAADPPAVLVAKFCGACHEGEHAESGFDLTTIGMDDLWGTPRLDQTALSNHLPEWRAAVSRVRGREMPPPDAEQPTPEERRRLIDWLGSEVSAVAAGMPFDPGPSVIRRMTRTEFGHAVRDLLAIDYDETQDLPPDPLAYGIDRVGAVLTLTPLRIEQHLDAATRVAQLAVPSPESTTRSAVAVGDWRGGQPRGNGLQGLVRVGRLSADFSPEEPGRYVIRWTLSGDQAGDESVKVCIRVAGRRYAELEVTSESGQPSSHAVVATLAGKDPTSLQVEFLNDYYDAATGEDRNLLIHGLEVAGPVDPQPSENAGNASARERVPTRERLACSSGAGPPSPAAACLAETDVESRA